MITVPPAYVERQTQRNGDVVGAWLASLPDLVRRLCAQWRVRPTGEPPLHGDENLVVPVLGTDGPAMLKLGPPGPAVLAEIAGLRAWAGRGAVAQLAAAPADYALLMERLDPHRSLRDLPVYDGASIAGELIARLAVDPTDEMLRLGVVPRLADIAATIAATAAARDDVLGNPVPGRFLEAARTNAGELAPIAADRLVHADLHQGNVLAATREPWLAIDARTVIGDPEYSVPELLWRGVDEVDGEAGVRRLLATVVDAGGLDADRARGWAIARCVDYWLWGLANGLTDDPVRCERIIAALLPSA